MRVIALLSILLSPTLGAQNPARVWSVSAKPTVVIGADGDTTAEFTTINGLARLSTGEIAVFNGSTDIRLFSPTGKFVKRLARPGSGPGELSAVWWFGRAGDSLLTFDFIQARVTVFDLPRAQVSTIPFVPSKARSRMVVNGMLGNGSWVAGTVSFPKVRPEGPHRDSTTVGFWRSGADTVQSVAPFPNFALFGYKGPTDVTFELDLLMANTTFLTVGNELWVGDPAARRIAVYDAAGRLARQVPVPFEPVQFQAAELRRLRDRRLATVKRPVDSARTVAMFDGSKRSLGRPAFSRLLLGRDGNVWVESFRVDRAAGAEYIAIDRAGRLLGRITSPPGVRFLELGADYALGVRKGENDVETVELFAVSR